MGITFYKLLTGRFPCQDAKDPCHLKELILEREINFEIIQDKEAREVIEKMLRKDPNDRITLDQII